MYIFSDSVCPPLLLPRQRVPISLSSPYLFLLSAHMKESEPGNKLYIVSQLLADSGIHTGEDGRGQKGRLIIEAAEAE